MIEHPVAYGSVTIRKRRIAADGAALAAALATLFSLMGALGCHRGPSRKPESIFRETPLAVIPQDLLSRLSYQDGSIFWVSVQFSRSGRHVAYNGTDGRKQYYVIDGKKQPAFDTVSHLFFSTDETLVAYTAKRGEKSMVVLGSIIGPELDTVFGPYYNSATDKWVPSFFTPDCNQVAYKAVDAGKAFAVVGTSKGPPFDDISEPVLNRDCRTVAYAAEEGGTHFVVVNGKRGPSFDKVSRPLFRQGRNVVYAATQGDKSFVIDCGQKGPAFNAVDDLVVSPDGSHVAYTAKLDDEAFVVKDGNRDPAYALVRFLTFDAFGNFFYRAATEIRGMWEFYVLNGSRLAQHNQVNGLVVSQGGDRWAYVAWGKDAVVVMPDGQSKGYHKIEELVLSPDGRHLAFKVRDDKGVYVVADGNEDKPVQWASTPVLSPDGRSAAYVAGVKGGVGGRCLVVNGQWGPLHNEVWNPVFSPDGRKVGYGTVDDGAIWWRVMDVRQRTQPLQK
jgi:hypothetical protein